MSDGEKTQDRVDELTEATGMSKYPGEQVGTYGTRGEGLDPAKALTYYGDVDHSTAKSVEDAAEAERAAQAEREHDAEALAEAMAAAEAQAKEEMSMGVPPLDEDVDDPLDDRPRPPRPDAPPGPAEPPVPPRRPAPAPPPDSFSPAEVRRLLRFVESAKGNVEAHIRDLEADIALYRRATKIPKRDIPSMIGGAMLGMLGLLGWAAFRGK